MGGVPHRLAPRRLYARLKDVVRTDRTSWVTTPDGTRLATDTFRPADAGRHPTVLIRTSYGRNGMTGLPIVLQARLLARRGYAVVVQDVRGRFGSTGEFLPMVNEVADARATLDWIDCQPWSDGRVGATGVSYLGATAWATALADTDMVKALAVGATYAGAGLPDDLGIVHLDTGMRWLQSLGAMVDDDEPAAQRLWQLVANRLPGATTNAAYHHLPVLEVDEAVLGRPNPIWRAWADHPSPADPFWSPGDLRGRVGQAPPTSHVGGWWDLFVDHQVADLRRQESAGRLVHAVIGGWGHLHPRVQTQTFAEAAALFDQHLLGLDPAPTGLDLWVGGTDAWWHLDRWPDTSPWSAAVGPGADLDGPADSFVLDPTDPTPSVGGRTLATDAGRARCTLLDGRGDVVAFTSPPLGRALTMIGRAQVQVPVDTDDGRGHLSVRLADVDPDGTARSLTDGYVPVADGAATVDLHPVAHTFMAGQRIRVYLAGASFPHYHRHLGTDDDPIRGTRTRPSRYRLGRGTIVLPQVEGQVALSR